MGANFVDTLQASAEFLGTGAIEVNDYATDIEDIVRRASLVLPRFKTVKASGAFHRYFEQTAIAVAAEQDPRNLGATVSGPARIERPAAIKAMTAQSNFSLFDVEVTRQQGQFASVEAKDAEDIVNAIEVLRGKRIWNGNDTSLSLPTTTQYMGLLSQITQQATINVGASIIDGLKAEVAAMVANQNYVVKPTAVIVNPILGDYIDREAKAAKIELKEVIVAGVTVNAISTQAGILPLVPDVYLPIATGAAYGFAAPPANNQTYFAAILSEPMIEVPVLSIDGNPNSRVFQLGLLGDLARKLIAVRFDTIIAVGGGYAHGIVAVYRP